MRTASTKGEVASINISAGKGTIKHPVTECSVDEHGIVGDAHAGPWRRQVSLLNEESIARFSSAKGREFRPGEFAENITVRGIDLGAVGELDRLVMGDVQLEVTQIGKECHGGDCAIFREVGECVMPKEGIFCRVLRGGTIRCGDVVECRFWGK